MLFIMRGTSCSGKDTFIEQHFEPHTVLSSDWYRKVLTNDVTNQQQNGIVFDHIRMVLEQRLKNRLPYTVINATNLKMKSISEFLDLAEKFGERVTVITLDPPEKEELIRRSKHRGSLGGLETPEDVLERHWESYYNSLPAFYEKADKYRGAEFTIVRINQDHEIIHTDYKGVPV